MPPKVPASKQKAPWLSRFNVGVCFAVGVSILILANYTRVAQQPVLAPGLQDSSAQGTPLRNTLDAATVQHINAASVGVTSASNSLTETHIETLEPVDANAEGSAPSKKKKKKALWEIVEDEVNAEDLPKEPSSGDHDKPQDEHMKEIFQDKELMQVEQEIFTKVKAYDDNQHFYDCGDLTTDWRVADVVNRCGAVDQCFARCCGCALMPQRAGTRTTCHRTCRRRSPPSATSSRLFFTMT